MTRINKFLADCGVASRRAAEDLIREGRVSVNGKTVTELSTQIADADKVAVNGAYIIRQSKTVYILLNKPAGTVTTCSDEFGRKTVLDVIADGAQSLPEHLRLYPVGRLDYETEGLLILTNDGEFARRITHPSSGIPKTYVAALNMPITRGQLDKLRTGVEIEGKITAHAKVHLCEDPNRRENAVEITISEGRNRQVRKMFESVGLRVTHLKRIKIGSLILGNLKVGQWRYLTDEEVKSFANIKKK